MIKMSDFPGWNLSGAEGPYRISPNYVVVIPTSKAVALTRRRGPLDWLAVVLGIAGVALVAALAGWVPRPRRRHTGDGDESADEAHDGLGDESDISDDDHDSGTETVATSTTQFGA
jgi:hypothetical protein